MTAAERRNEIKRILASAKTPTSASALAAQFSVSRQVIVGDIALLRSAGTAISATPRGYVMSGSDMGIIHQIVCAHDDGQQMIDELNTIVDYGCAAINVIVEHPVYGEITGELRINTRYDVKLFCQKISEAAAPPLSILSGGTHIHTVSCPDEEVFQRVEQELKDLGIWIATIN